MTPCVKQLAMGGGHRWPCRGPLVTKALLSPEAEGRSLQMQSLGLTATTESPGGPRAGISGSPKRDHLPLQLAGSSMRDGSS